MPVLRQGVDANGKPRFVRAPYKPEGYSVPAGWIESVKQDWGQYGPDELIADPGGPFGGMAKLRIVEHDRKRYQLIVGGGANEFAIEVELTGAALGEIRALPPEEAYAIARESDATRTPPVEEGPVDPMMPPNQRS